MNINGVAWSDPMPQCELTRYIHLNPVRAKVMERPEEYAWSSYPGYLWKKKRVDWMEYGWILSQFGSDEAGAARRYRRFVESLMEEPGDSPLADGVGQVLLGGEEILGKVKSLLRGKEIRQEVVERKRFRDAPRIEDILSAVGSVLGMDKAMITRRGRKGNEARELALYLTKRYTGLSNGEIGSLFGGIQSSGVTKASGRVEEKMKRDVRIHGLIGAIMSKVKT